jgi:hypothetical protein
MTTGRLHFPCVEKSRDNTECARKRKTGKDREKKHSLVASRGSLARWRAA